MAKKEINNRRANEIAERISTPEGRVSLAVAMKYPIDFPLPGETEKQRITRRCREFMDSYRGEEKVDGKP